jgi:predicted CXXCH cytochrome family protein
MKNLIVGLLVVSACIFFVASTSGSTSKAKMPGLTVLDSIEKMYGPVKFDHEIHTLMAGSCGECHHQHGTDLGCKNCHSLDSSAFKKTVENSFLPCKSCHGEINSDMPGMPSLKVAYHAQCFGCHRGMGNVGLDPKGCTEQCHVRKEQ